MDWIRVLTWALLVLGVIAHVADLARVGEPRKPKTYESVATGWLVFGFAMVPVYGRVIGWW